MSDEHPIDKVTKTVVLFVILAIIFYMLWLAFNVNVIPSFVNVF